MHSVFMISSFFIMPNKLNWIVVTRKRNKVNLQVPSNTPMSKRPTDMAEFESRQAAAFSAADR